MRDTQNLATLKVRGQIVDSPFRECFIIQVGTDEFRGECLCFKRAQKSSTRLEWHGPPATVAKHGGDGHETTAKEVENFHPLYLN